MSFCFLHRNFLFNEGNDCTNNGYEVDTRSAEQKKLFSLENLWHILVTDVIRSGSRQKRYGSGSGPSKQKRIQYHKTFKNLIKKTSYPMFRGFKLLLTFLWIIIYSFFFKFAICMRIQGNYTDSTDPDPDLQHCSE